MTEITERLPFELANIIYSYVGTHPVAKLIEDKLNEEMISEFCVECRMYVAGNQSRFEAIGRDWNCYDGKCEYCYAESLGTEVYTCDDCGEKCYKYGVFENTDDGLFCGACYSGWLEMQNEEEEE
jgi:hypothetical protein